MGFEPRISNIRSTQLAKIVHQGQKATSKTSEAIKNDRSAS